MESFYIYFAKLGLRRKSNSDINKPKNPKSAAPPPPREPPFLGAEELLELTSELELEMNPELELELKPALELEPVVRLDDELELKLLLT